jgi:hypothetical protein
MLAISIIYQIVSCYDNLVADVVMALLEVLQDFLIN